MLKKMKMALKKHQNFVRFSIQINIELIILVTLYVLVNELVEEEIKSGIAPERIVSKCNLINLINFCHYF